MDSDDLKDLKNDMQILKDFILGFTSRDTDKEWQAFRFYPYKVTRLVRKGGRNGTNKI